MNPTPGLWPLVIVVNYWPHVLAFVLGLVVGLVI